MFFSMIFVCYKITFILMTAPYHEIYTAYPQPYLLRENFKPTEAQLQFAKQSLIEKHKIANGIQQLLFCKKANLSEE